MIMTKITTPQPFSDSFWPSSFRNTSNSTTVYSNKKDEEQVINKLLSSIDDSPEFYDPYSELNLFLAKKVQSVLSSYQGACKKWNLKIQEKLIEKISLEFQNRFPHYRLGACALKVVWERSVYYSQQLELLPQAKQDQIDISCFIKENLKNYMNLPTSPLLHPSHFATQLAAKTRECVAIVNGEKIDLSTLTKQIWSIQRHLLICQNLSCVKSPYDEYDAIDKQIVKIFLEKTAKKPLSSKQSFKQEIHSLLDVKEEKIERWIHQSDMIYRVIEIHPTPLLKHLESHYRALNHSMTHSLFIQTFCQKFSQSPNDHKIWMLYKYVWYHLFCSEEESSYDRFLKWHAKALLEQFPSTPLDYLLKELETVVDHQLSLIPFDLKRAKAAFEAISCKS